MKNKQGVYTQGSVRKTLLKTTVAMLAGTLALSGYNIADTYFVGQLPGSDSLAAMGFTLPIIMLIGCLFRGLGIGMVMPMAHSLGAGKHPRAAKLVTYGFILMVIVSIITMILGMTFNKAVFKIFGAKGVALDLTIDYMNIWYFGCVTAALSMSGNDLLITTGDNKIASLMMIAGMLLNVIFDPIFIFGFGFVPAMGIKGAALATIIAQLFTTTMIWIILCRRHSLLSFANLELRQLRSVWKVMIKYAIPAIIGMLLMPLGAAVMTRIVAHFDNIAVAANAAVSRIEMVAFVIPMAMGISVMPMIAQNYGAGLYQRILEIRKFAMRFAIFFLMVMAIIFFILSNWIATKFSQDTAIQELMAFGLRVIPWGLAGVEVHRFAGFFYTGCGHPHKAAWLNGVRIIGLLIPFSLIALYFNSIKGLFFARLCADVIAGVIGYYCARHLTSNLLNSKIK